MRISPRAGAWWLVTMPLLLISTLEAAGNAAPNDEGAQQYVAAADLQGRGEYSRAAGAWQEFIDAHKGDERIPRAYCNLGVCLSRDGKYPQAIAILKAAAEYPQADVAADALYALALAEEASGDRAAAIQSCQQFLARFPKHRLGAEVRLAAGRCLHQSGKDAEAQEPLRRAMESGGGTTIEAAHWLAQALVHQEQPREALAVLDQVAPRAGDTPWAGRLLVDRADAVYAIPERRKEAISLYAEVAAKHPKDPEAPRALSMAAWMALEAGDFSAALARAAKFQAAYPDNALVPDVLYVVAKSKLQSGKLAEAEVLYRQLIEKYPNHPSAALWKVRRAAILHAQKKYEETIRALQPLLADLRTPDVLAEARWLIGMSQLELKQPAAAAKSLAASLKAQPTWRRAFETCLALAEADRQAGDLAGAQAAVRRAIAAFPQNPLLDRAWYRLGTYLALAGQTKAAAEAFGKVVAQWPASPVAPYALHELGCAQLTLKDAAGAEATFTRLLEKHPPPALARKAQYGRAMARQQEGKSAAAAADLEAVLAAWPDAQEKSDARFLLGICQVELKQPDKAAATFRALLTDDPKHAAREEALHQWAWALKRAGRAAEAAEVFAKLAAEYPQGPSAAEARFEVGQSLFRRKDYATAAEAYYAVAQKAPGTPFAEKAAYELGWCYFHQGNFSDAQKTFAYCLAKYPGRPLAAEAAFLEAECWFKQGKAAEALAAYAKLKPQANCERQAAILLHGGQAAGQLARWAQSAEWLEKLVYEQPDSPLLPDALCELGVARQHLGKPADAIAAYQQAIAKGDREPAARAQFLIGKIQSDQHKPQEALKSFLKALYGYSYPKWQAEAAYEAARCYEALGQKARAAAMYQELIEKFPKSDRADAAKKRLARP